MRKFNTKDPKNLNVHLADLHLVVVVLAVVASIVLQLVPHIALVGRVAVHEAGMKSKQNGFRYISAQMTLMCMRNT